MSKQYVIAYDILSPKRAVRVRKLLYAYAFGGQKSVLEIPLNTKRELTLLLKELQPLLNDEDSVNIIEVNNTIKLFGKADILKYDKGSDNSMRVAFVDKKGVELKVEYKSLKIDEKKIPLRLLDTVVLGSACALESKDILKMTKEGISLLLVSAKSDDMAIVFSAKSKSAELKMEQYLAQKKALVIAKYFIAQKVELHAQQLLTHDIVLDTSKVLSNIEKAKSTQRLLGIEGSFSSQYFRQYFKLFPKKLHLGKRSKQPPLDLGCGKPPTTPTSPFPVFGYSY